MSNHNKRFLDSDDEFEEMFGNGGKAKSNSSAEPSGEVIDIDEARSLEEEPNSDDMDFNYSGPVVQQPTTFYNKLDNKRKRLKKKGSPKKAPPKKKSRHESSPIHSPKSVSISLLSDSDEEDFVKTLKVNNELSADSQASLAKRMKKVSLKWKGQVDPNAMDIDPPIQIDDEEEPVLLDESDDEGLGAAIGASQGVGVAVGDENDAEEAEEAGLEVMDNKSNSTCAKNFFITIPQTGTLAPKDVGPKFMEFMKKANVTEVCAFHETGKESKHPHMHILIFCKEKKRIAYKKWWEAIGIPNPKDGNKPNRPFNIAAIRDPMKARLYLMKEQGKEGILAPWCYYSTGKEVAWEAWSSLPTTVNRMEQAALEIVSSNGAITKTELAKKYGWMAVERHDKYLDGVYNKVWDIIAHPNMDWVPFHINELMEPEEETRYKKVWNLFVPELKAGRSMAVKHNVLCVLSRPNMHKTGFLKYIARFVELEWVDGTNGAYPADKDWRNPKVLAIDSFDPSPSPQQGFVSNVLEKFIDMDPNSIHNAKFGKYRASLQRPVIVINTNVRPDKWYRPQIMVNDMGQIGEATLPAALEARLNVFYIEEPLKGFDDPDEKAFKLPDNLVKRWSDVKDKVKDL